MSQWCQWCQWCQYGGGHSAGTSPPTHTRSGCSEWAVRDSERAGGMLALLLLLAAADWVQGGSHHYDDPPYAGGNQRHPPDPPYPPPHTSREHDMPACSSSAEHGADGWRLVEVSPSERDGVCAVSVVAGAVLEVVCRADHDTTRNLRWDDGDGWSSSKCRSSQACRLRLAVDAADHGASFTCSDGRRHHTVRLHLLPPPGPPGELAADAVPKELRRGDHWTDDSCAYSKLFLPRRAPGSAAVGYEKRIIKGADIIRDFQAGQLGAVVYCVRYQLGQPEPDSVSMEPAYKEFRRKQDKFVLRLAGGAGGAWGPASGGTQHVQDGQWRWSGTEGGDTTRGPAGGGGRAAGTTGTSPAPDDTSPDHTAAWVGGALGGIIVLLLAALALLVRRHGRRRGQQQSVPYVVYTEVSVPERGPPAPPPARAACPPYARVVGTLAAPDPPPDPPPREKAPPLPLHHIYCTVK